MINGNFGYYDAAGKEASVYLFKFPDLCLTCLHCQSELESVQCHITRLLQLSSSDFNCESHLDKEAD